MFHIKPPLEREVFCLWAAGRFVTVQTSSVFAAKEMNPSVAAISALAVLSILLISLLVLFLLVLRKKHLQMSRYKTTLEHLHQVQNPRFLHQNDSNEWN